MYFKDGFREQNYTTIVFYWVAMEEDIEVSNFFLSRKKGKSVTFSQGRYNAFVNYNYIFQYNTYIVRIIIKIQFGYISCYYFILFLCYL